MCLQVAIEFSIKNVKKKKKIDFIIYFGRQISIIGSAICFGYITGFAHKIAGDFCSFFTMQKKKL